MNRLPLEYNLPRTFVSTRVKLRAAVLALGLFAPVPVTIFAAPPAPADPPAEEVAPQPDAPAEPAPRRPAGAPPPDPSQPPLRAGVANRFSPTPELRGRNIEDIRILGNRQVSTAAIRNLIRTRVGEPYDPATVQEDYQRIYRELRKFTNVEARVEPTDAGGVVVVFAVSEQQQIGAIRFRGNRKIDDLTLRAAVEIGTGEAIDPFRVALARNAIVGMYRERNYPFAHVDVPQEPLRERGELIFNIVEGPNVRVRKVEFKSGSPTKRPLAFSEDRLQRQVRTKAWVFILNPGRYDPDQLEEDVGALRRFYESKGYFDARVGRKVVWSPDLTEAQVNFVIDEGPRYTIERVSFEGNKSLNEADLRSRIRLTEGMAFDNDVLQRDLRQVVRAYSPFGFIYAPGADDPDYLQVDAKPIFLRQQGRVELVYTIREGKPFHVGPIIVKGNYKSKDKLVLRDLRFAPGELYDSGKVQDAIDRLRATPYFEFVNVTPVGNDPTHRALLVEVGEARTASFNIGAGINSNGGVGGNITFEQRNYDIGNPPDSWRDLFSDRAFTGAGQRFRVTLEPGTRASNASILFAEPWLFDQPYGLTTEGYLRTRRREEYDDQRTGGRLTLSRRFGYEWSAGLTLRGEDVLIDNIDDPPLRAPEYLEAEGHNTLTSVGLQLRRSTVNPGVLPYRGTETTVAVEGYGLLGGEYDFQKFTLNWDGYWQVAEDLTERRTVFALHANAGYITGDSVFFERFYAGGIGSVRGFEFRGISPRSGLDDDAVGGDFILNGTAELNFPLVGESLRGVVFADAGTVEEDFEVSTIRTSVGAGFRLVLPIFGQAPLAVDFGVPITKDDEDETQIVSFSFGFVQ